MYTEVKVTRKSFVNPSESTQKTQLGKLFLKNDIIDKRAVEIK